MSIVWSFERYNHSVVVSDLYVLKEEETLNIGDVVEFTADPPVMVQPLGQPARYEVRRGCVNPDVYELTNTGPDDAIGFSASVITATDSERGVAVLLHGFGIATACDLGDIRPNTPLKCCSIGQVQDLNHDALTAMEVANFKLAKSITDIYIGRPGVIFKGD